MKFLIHYRNNFSGEHFSEYFEFISCLACEEFFKCSLDISLICGIWEGRGVPFCGSVSILEDCCYEFCDSVDEGSL
jgi:hypothetical protein